MPAGWLYWRYFTRRAAIRVVRRFRARIDRFKLTGKKYIAESLLGDEAIAAAVREHAASRGVPPAVVWRTVREYIDEIVPAFNLLAYYQVGIAASRTLLNLFYRVNVSYVRRESFDELPRESIVIYLMNHRSNADYVLAGYALAGQVAISWAVGEWARVFPLEYLFKSFGSYFIRRRFREPLYHTVLERYVQLVTRNAVTQGIFPEGGLSRDGKLRPAKIGLLDYALGVAREPGFAARMYLVPVGINFDRVLEDRSLLRELRASEGRPAAGGDSRRCTKCSASPVERRPPALETVEAIRAGGGRHRRARPARALVPRPRARGARALLAAAAERLGAVQSLTDDAMRRVGSSSP